MKTVQNSRQNENARTATPAILSSARTWGHQFMLATITATAMRAARIMSTRWAMMSGSPRRDIMTTSNDGGKYQIHMFLYEKTYKVFFIVDNDNRLFQPVLLAESVYQCFGIDPAFDITPLYESLPGDYRMIITLGLPPSGRTADFRMVTLAGAVEICSKTHDRAKAQRFALWAADIYNALYRGVE